MAGISSQNLSVEPFGFGQVTGLMVTKGRCEQVKIAGSGHPGSPSTESHSCRFA
jgi:hypothetical protein